MADEALPRKPTPHHRRGTSVGRYVLLDPVAEGGMGVVYAAFDSQLDRKVAIKLLRATLTAGEDAAEAEARLLREAQAMARLAHPNVVAVHDVGVVEGSVFLAMEYVEGGTLKDRLGKLGSWREGLALLKEAGRGLAAAHAAGLVHRDFKPDNVLVGADGRVRVTDFGIARAEDAAPATRRVDSEPRSSGRRPLPPTTPLRSSIDTVRSTATSLMSAATSMLTAAGTPRGAAASQRSAPDSTRGTNGTPSVTIESAKSAGDPPPSAVESTRSVLEAASAVEPPPSARDFAKRLADSARKLAIDSPRPGEATRYSADAPTSVVRAPSSGSGPAASSPSGRSLQDPLTLTGDLLGTVGYMAPEQAFGERVDARSDQFSFCATLYLALYGEKPFRDADVDTYVAALLGPVRDAPPGSKVPQWLRRVVVKGLSLFPAGRYASMDELLAALEHDPAVARRRWLSAGAVALLGAVAALGYRQAEATQTMRCESAEADLSAVWDSAVKEDVRRAFAATGGVTERDSFERVAKALDAYAGTWRGARTEVCAATKIRHEQSEEVYTLRADCLDREKTELRALTSVFRRVDKEGLEQSVKAAYGLTSVAWCQDVNALRASPGLPVEPNRRAAVLDARAALANATSLGLAGNYAESRAEARRARDEAEQAGHRGTVAEALFELGYDEYRLSHYDEATARLEDAMADGYASGDDAVFIRAASRLAFITGDKLYHPADGQRFLGLARAGLERVGASDALETDVVSTDAVLLVAAGYPERAAPMLERVVRFYRASLDNPNTAIQLNNLGYAEHLSHHNEEALHTLDESRAMLASLFGVENTTTAIPLCNIGASNLALGNLADAERALYQALGIFEHQTPDGYWSGWVLQYLTLASNLGGDWATTVAQGHQGLGIAAKLSSSQRLLPGISVNTADALLAQGSPEQALPLCEQALEVQKRIGLVEPGRTYDWDSLRCRGEALLALGRTQEAAASLESSVALARRVFPWDLARAKFALARAVLPTDRARALTLAQEARDTLAPLPQAKVFLRDLDAWMKAHA